MSRPEGLPKTGGRQKGTPNRRTEALNELLESLGLDPVKEIARLYPQLMPFEQVKVCLDLMSFIYPKRKAAELSLAEDLERQEKDELSRMTTEELWEAMEPQWLERQALIKRIDEK